MYGCLCCPGMKSCPRHVWLPVLPRDEEWPTTCLASGYLCVAQDMHGYLCCPGMESGPDMCGYLCYPGMESCPEMYGYRFCPGMNSGPGDIWLPVLPRDEELSRTCMATCVAHGWRVAQKYMAAGFAQG
jgi:hypothetical protein